MAESKMTNALNKLRHADQLELNRLLGKILIFIYWDQILKKRLSHHMKNSWMQDAAEGRIAVFYQAAHEKFGLLQISGIDQEEVNYQYVRLFGNKTLKSKLMNSPRPLQDYGQSYEECSPSTLGCIDAVHHGPSASASSCKNWGHNSGRWQGTSESANAQRVKLGEFFGFGYARVLEDSEQRCRFGTRLRQYLLCSMQFANSASCVRGPKPKRNHTIGIWAMKFLRISTRTVLVLGTAEKWVLCIGEGS